MNGLFVPDHILRRRDLDPGERLLLALIEFRMGTAGKCWWSHAKLGEDAGMTKSTVQRTAARLVEKGALKARLDQSRRVIIYERSFPQVGDPPAGRSTHPGESIDSSGESQKKNYSSTTCSGKENSSSEQEQRCLEFGPERKPVAAEHESERKRRVGVCRCGFRGRPVWVDGAEQPVAVEDCPRCHRRGYDMAALAAAVNG